MFNKMPKKQQKRHYFNNKTKKEHFQAPDYGFVFDDT